VVTEGRITSEPAVHGAMGVKVRRFETLNEGAVQHRAAGGLAVCPVPMTTVSPRAVDVPHRVGGRPLPRQLRPISAQPIPS